MTALWILLGLAGLFGAWKAGLLKPRAKKAVPPKSVEAPSFVSHPSPVASHAAPPSPADDAINRAIGFAPELLRYDSANLLAAGNYVLGLEVESRIAHEWAKDTSDHRANLMLEQRGPKRAPKGV